MSRPHRGGPAQLVRRLVLLCITPALAPATVAAQPGRLHPSAPPPRFAMDSLQARLEARLARQRGATVGVYYRSLADDAELAINADIPFHAASTMKLPVMIQYFREVDSGRLGADARLRLTNTFASIVDGSPYALDAVDDSDSALYARVGQEVPVLELVDRMITRSSNLATNAVIALVGAPAAQATARSLGAATMQVRRGVEDGKAYRAGLNNTTSARDLGALLDAIGRGTAASGSSIAAMLDILGRQTFNDEIPAALPPGTAVAHKTGWISGVLHDAALVRPLGRAPFVLVVLTAAIDDRQDARRLIQDVAREVWSFDTARGLQVPGVRAPESRVVQ